MARHYRPRPRKAPPVSIVYERSVAYSFLDAGYDLVRGRDGQIRLVRDDHRVPLFGPVALHFETRHPSIIQSEP